MKAEFLRAAGLFSKIFLILFCVFLFFFTYNKFLVDHTLRSLEFSLANVKEGRVSTVEDILKRVSVSTAITNNLRDSAKLNYVQTSLENKGATDDAKLLLSSMIRVKKQKRGVLLNFLDGASRAFERIRNSILALGRREKLEALAGDFDKAKAYFDQNDFSNAKPIFNRIVRYGYGTSYERSASLYLKNIQELETKEKKISDILRRLEQGGGPDELQKLSLEAGTLYADIQKYDLAQKYLLQVKTISAESEIAQKANFILGLVAKNQGNLQKATAIFNEILSKPLPPDLILSAKLQIADILRRENKTQEAADYYYAFAQGNKGSIVADIALFEASCLYRFDLGDTNRSAEVLRELAKEYPGSDLMIETKRITSEDIPAEDDEFYPGGDKKTGLRALWNRALLGLCQDVPPFSTLFEFGQETAEYFAFYMIEGSIEQALLERKGKGDTLVIERTAKFLTVWARDRMDVFLKKYKKIGIILDSFEVKFPMEGWVSVRGVVGIGSFKFDSFAIGRMYLKDITEPYNKWGEEKDVSHRWVVFEIIKARVGPFEIPMNITNAFIKPAEAAYNRKQVFTQEELEISPYVGRWAGKVKYDRRELRQRLSEIEDLKRRRGQQMSSDDKI